MVDKIRLMLSQIRWRSGEKFLTIDSGVIEGCAIQIDTPNEAERAAGVLFRLTVSQAPGVNSIFQGAHLPVEQREQGKA